MVAGAANILETDVFNGEFGHAAKHNAVNDQVNYLTQQVGDSTAAASAGFLRLAGTVPGSVPVVKPAGDGRAGVWEMTHNDTTGYLFHLLAGAAMGHSQALIALGVDNDGIGLLIPNKKKGRAIVIDQQAGITDATAYGVHATQRSTLAPLVRLEQQGAGVAPVLQLLSFAGFSGRLIDIINDDGAVGDIAGDTGILTWARTIRLRDTPAAVASYLRLDSGAGANSSTMKMSYHGDDEDVFFGATGAAGQYYPYKFAHSGSSFAIQTAANLTAAASTAPVPSEVGAWTTQISVSNASGVSLAAGKLRASTVGLGFFGAAAVAQPAAVADAADAATVITQLNALLSRLRTLGLIAP